MKSLSGIKIAVVLFVTIVMAVAVVSRFASRQPVIVSGEVTLEEALGPKAEGIRTLFITLFDAESPMPMPYGAARFVLGRDAHPGSFFHFSITTENLQVMNPDRPHPQQLRVKARLDRDGQGGQDQPDDLVGSVDQIPVGSRDIIVKIDKLGQATLGMAGVKFSEGKF